MPDFVSVYLSECHSDLSWRHQSSTPVDLLLLYFCYNKNCVTFRTYLRCNQLTHFFKKIKNTNSPVFQINSFSLTFKINLWLFSAVYLSFSMTFKIWHQNWTQCSSTVLSNGLYRTILLISGFTFLFIEQQQQQNLGFFFFFFPPFLFVFVITMEFK